MELDIEKLKAETEANLNRNKVVLVAIFSTCLGLVLGLVYMCPSLTDQEKAVLSRIPKTPQHLLEVGQVVSSYTEQSYWYVMCLFCTVYLVLQSFAIPGPLLLSILAGFLFGNWVGLCVVCVCATTGATLCYLISETLGKGLVIRYFPSALLQANAKLNEHRHNLFFYLLFLRITPILPNWLINISSPIVGVDIVTYLGATFLGMVPANCIHVNTGMALSSVSEIGLSYKSLVFLLLVGSLALVPTVLVKSNKLKGM